MVANQIYTNWSQKFPFEKNTHTWGEFECKLWECYQSIETHKKGHKLHTLRYIPMSPINSRNNLINALTSQWSTILFVCVCVCPCPCGCNQFDSFIFCFLERHWTIHHLMEFISSQHAFRLLFVVMLTKKRSSTNNNHSHSSTSSGLKK